MPYKRELNNLFHFGIEESLHNANLLCERINKEVFTGDILTQIKQKIESASTGIAVLTDANPNVYLEIGYAWGKGRPTVLLIRKGEEPEFNLAGQKYLEYGDMDLMDLKKRLA